MRGIIILLLVWTISFSQNKPVESIDSVAYYLKLAAIYKQKNNYKLAITNSNLAYKYASDKNNILNKSIALTSLGTIYFELKKIPDAKDAFIKSINLLSTLSLNSQLGLNYYKLGLCSMSLEEYKKAEEYFNKAERIYEVLNIENTQLLLLQKAIIYNNKGKEKEANAIFKKLISEPDDEDTYNVKAEALFQLGCIENNKKRSHLALNYLNRALILNTKSNSNLEQRINILFLLSTINDKIFNYSVAHNYLKDHVFLRDSLIELNKKRLDANDYISLKESERIDLFAQLSKENEVQQKTNSFAKMISVLSIALIGILSLLSFALYKNNIIRTKSNKLLQEKNNELELAKDKVEKASQARNDFLSTVSHELRTPLNAIIGITHLLIDENPKESQVHYLNSLKFSGNYLITFINEILEINRIESKTVQIEKIDFNLKELLLNIQNSLSELARENNNVFSLHIDEMVPDIVSGDSTKMLQIFLNLINNALKFTNNGKVEVFVKVISTDENKIKIHFSVQDSGIGIAEEHQKSIFESFTQSSTEINRKYGGTGLGLAIVKKLLELLGSEIKLNSEVEKGSNFYFDLQFDISESTSEDAVTVLPLIQEDIDLLLNGKSVLIVEDNKINQMITKKILQKKNVRITIIENGEDAIEEIRNNTSYDLVLMDIHLPGINGTIATSEIRKFNTTIPIIALTAISLHENREKLLSFGMNDVIKKPFDVNNFYSVIFKALNNSRSIV